MKNIVVIILAICSLSIHSQQVTDLLFNKNFKYTQQASITKNGRLFISNVDDDVVYEYDLSNPDSNIKERRIELNQKRPVNLEFDDNSVYLNSANYNYEKGYITKRDASDLTSNEVAIMEYDFFIAGKKGAKIETNKDFLYVLTNNEIKRFHKDNLNTPEVILTANSDQFFTTFTFFENEMYYGVYNKLNLTSTVYSLDVSNPLILEKRIATFNRNDQVMYLVVTAHNIYFGNESSESFYAIYEKDRLKPNTPVTKLTSGKTFIGALFVYNNLLHFIISGGNIQDIHKLSRIESTLSTPGKAITDSAFKITPNPNNGTFTLNGLDRNETIKQVTVFDLAGREVYKSQANLALTTNLALNLSSGTYVLALETTNGVYRQKMVIK